MIFFRLKLGGILFVFFVLGCKKRCSYEIINFVLDSSKVSNNQVCISQDQLNTKYHNILCKCIDSSITNLKFIIIDKQKDKTMIYAYDRTTLFVYGQTKFDITPLTYNADDEKPYFGSVCPLKDHFYRIAVNGKCENSQLKKYLLYNDDIVVDDLFFVLNNSIDSLSFLYTHFSKDTLYWQGEECKSERLIGYPTLYDLLDSVNIAL